MKYDFAKLKQEYFNSDIDEISNFLKEKYGEKLAKSNQIKNNTLGRSKEKQAYKQKIVDMAIEKSAKKSANDLTKAIPLERLIQMKLDFFDLIEMAIERIPKARKMDMDQIVKGLNAIKTELGEPTKVTTNTNINHTEELSDEDKELINNYIKQKHGSNTDNNK